MDKLLMTMIDVDTWNEARWQGVLFLDSPNEPPAMGLFFLNELPARKIFTDLVAKIGKKDEDELLRVTIVEGSMLGQEPGYSVYLGPDIENIAAKAEREGHPFEKEVLATLGRFRRMNPVKGSPFLSQFKKSYKEHGRFQLVPAFGPTSKPIAEFNLAIQKTSLHLRLVEDLTDQDVESVVLMKDPPL